MCKPRSLIACCFAALAGGCGLAAASESARIVARTDIGLSVASDGSYAVTAMKPAWQFAGNISSRLSGIALRTGQDRAGTFQEIVFAFDAPAGGARRGIIRAYEDRPVVLFKLVFPARGSTSEAFPSLSSYPRGLHHLSYTSLFGGFSFDRFGSDGPWVFFDDQANAFIFSPASHYMNAALSLGAHNELTSRIAADAGQVQQDSLRPTCS